DLFYLFPLLPKLTPPPPLSTLPLHDALPIYDRLELALAQRRRQNPRRTEQHHQDEREAEEQHPDHFGLEQHAAEKLLLYRSNGRSEEHTSELQLPDHLVCRLLLEKKKKNNQQ